MNCEKRRWPFVNIYFRSGVMAIWSLSDSAPVGGQLPRNPSSQMSPTITFGRSRAVVSYGGKKSCVSSFEVNRFRPWILSKFSYLEILHGIRKSLTATSKQGTQYSYCSILQIWPWKFSICSSFNYTQYSMLPDKMAIGLWPQICDVTSTYV